MSKCECGHEDRDHMGNGWGDDTQCLRCLDEECSIYCLCKKYLPKGTILI